MSGKAKSLAQEAGMLRLVLIPISLQVFIFDVAYSRAPVR
jgi:hypothetical protein